MDNPIAATTEQASSNGVMTTPLLALSAAVAAQLAAVAAEFTITIPIRSPIQEIDKSRHYQQEPEHLEYHNKILIHYAIHPFALPTGNGLLACALGNTIGAPASR